MGHHGDPKIGPMKLRPIASVAQRVIGRERWKPANTSWALGRRLGEEGPKSTQPIQLFRLQADTDRLNAEAPRIADIEIVRDPSHQA